jgi:hypothetical protein
VTFRISTITTETAESMTPNTSIKALGRNSEHRAELEEEQLSDTNVAVCHEASYRHSRPTSEAVGVEHGTQTVQRKEAQQVPGRIEELSKDNFLQFRDEWVRNRARDIRRAGSISFKTCSEDTASITALNEFYRWRIFDGLKVKHRDEKEVEIGMMQGSRDFESFPKDVAAAERLQMCRIVCREKGRQVIRKTCRRGAMSRA